MFVRTKKDASYELSTALKNLSKSFYYGKWIENGMNDIHRIYMFNDDTELSKKLFKFVNVNITQVNEESISRFCFKLSNKLEKTFNNKDSKYYNDYITAKRMIGIIENDQNCIDEQIIYDLDNHEIFRLLVEKLGFDMYCSDTVVLAKVIEKYHNEYMNAKLERPIALFFDSCYKLKMCDLDYGIKRMREEMASAIYNRDTSINSPELDNAILYLGGETCEDNMPIEERYVAGVSKCIEKCGMVNLFKLKTQSKQNDCKNKLKIIT